MRCEIKFGYSSEVLWYLSIIFQRNERTGLMICIHSCIIRWVLYSSTLFLNNAANVCYINGLHKAISIILLMKEDSLNMAMDLLFNMEIPLNTKNTNIGTYMTIIHYLQSKHIYIGNKYMTHQCLAELRIKSVILIVFLKKFLV